MELLNQLRQHASDYPDRIAIRECCGGKALTYAQFHRQVGQFSEELCRHISQPSALLLKTSSGCAFHVAFFACLSAGHAVFPVAGDTTDIELSQLVQRCGAAGIITDDLHLNLTTSGAKSAVGEPALLLQSSGTTGLPKIVCRDAKSLDASARQIVQSVGMRSDDRILTCVPLSHSYGLEHGLLAPIYAGATVHIARGFDVHLIARELIESKITIFPSVPAVFELFVQFADLPERFPALRLTYSAGGPLPTNINDTFVQRFGLPIAQLYGATEIGSVVFSDPGLAGFDPRSVGRPMPGVQIKLDADGQLLVRAASMMRGYLDADPPFTSDGFFPTGDLARIDDNQCVTLIGRSKLLIDIGGRKVNPLEVEQALNQHPGVAECVVVSIPQTQTLRRLKAIVVPAVHHAPSPDDLRQFLRDHLSPYKIPRIFELRRSLPKSATGKVLRHLLENS
ncbi:MAG TPA: class I adenylate-forming enzyme family protein [Tepidisphaeraceae bacterium]|nr:class I adenylate-forming enzyme family protein [Tepidisphaeraceae bacterium]